MRYGCYFNYTFDVQPLNRQHKTLTKTTNENLITLHSLAYYEIKLRKLYYILQTLVKYLNKKNTELLRIYTKNLYKKQYFWLDRSLRSNINSSYLKIKFVIKEHKFNRNSPITKGNTNGKTLIKCDSVTHVETKATMFISFGVFNCNAK